MKKNPSVEFIVANKLCTSCGICEDVCPTNAIQFSRKKGILVPVIDKNTCINHLGCSQCFQMCSGSGIMLRSISKKLYAESKKFDYYAGYYLNLYAGYSNNYDVRFHSASGGVLSQFLIYLLKKEFIDGAIITKFKEDAPTITETIIATTEEEILSGKSSKYCPVALNGIITKIKSLEGRYVVVGIPCQIHGFRTYEQKNPDFRKKIVGYFSIFCSSTRTFEGTEYLLSRYNVKKNDIRSFAYRDDGCLGYLKIITETQQIKIPYREYYKKLRSFFKPKRCLYCVDHFGDLADISFGDIQTGKYRKDKVGINSIVTRNPIFDELLLKAKKESELTLETISISILKDSQKHMLHHKKELASLNMKIEKKLGNKIPIYDVEFPKKYSFSDYAVVFFIKLQRQIGKIRGMWFLIDIYNKIVKNEMSNERQFNLFLLV